MAGVVCFAVVTAVLTVDGEGLASSPTTRAANGSSPADPLQPTGGPSLDLLRWIALGMLLMVIPVGVLLRSGRLRVAAEMDDEAAAGQIYANSNLLCFAVIEGGALFNIVVWLLLGNPLPNAFAAGLVVLLMVVNLPSEAGLQQLRELQQPRR